MWQEYEVETEKLACVRRELVAERSARLCEREEWETEREDVERERWAQEQVFQETLKDHEKGSIHQICVHFRMSEL